MQISGTLAVPGDKSITHRALFLASLARGESRIRGALTSLDAKSTARILRLLGVEVGRFPVSSFLFPGSAPLRVRSTGRWHRPRAVLNCGNSGTSARLGLGVMAGHRFSATFAGDESLRRRPMRRVTDMLVEMGAKVRYGTDGRTDGQTDGLPVTITGGKLREIEARLPVSSAQLKSAVLFAGVVGQVPVRILEPDGRSRDHTERMLRAFGYTAGSDKSDKSDGSDGWIDFQPTGRIEPAEYHVPGDISSAAFLIGAAVLADEGELTLRDVGVNPTRDGFLGVLARMGARVERENLRDWMGEPVADLVTGPAKLRATEVHAHEIPGLIDEVPMLAVLASRAEGTTRFRRVGELRVKESDRLSLLARNLVAVGVDAQVDGDDLVVEGTDRTPCGRVITLKDHRIAMAFMVLNRVNDAELYFDDQSCAAVSFPDFRETLRSVTKEKGKRKQQTGKRK